MVNIHPKHWGPFLKAPPVSSLHVNQGGVLIAFFPFKGCFADFCLITAEYQYYV